MHQLFICAVQSPPHSLGDGVILLDTKEGVESFCVQRSELVHRRVPLEVLYKHEEWYLVELPSPTFSGKDQLLVHEAFRDDGI